MTTRDAVIGCARELLGVRFAHQGRSALYGVDCLGFLMVTAEKAGLTFEGQAPEELDARDYGTRPNAVALRAKLERWLVAVKQAVPGDILLLEVQSEPQHLALVSDYPVAGELAMIHAYAPARKVVEHRYDAVWRRATQGIFRLPQLS